MNIIFNKIIYIQKCLLHAYYMGLSFYLDIRKEYIKGARVKIIKNFILITIS